MKHFRDPGAFAAFVPEMIAAVERATPVAVRAGGTIIRDEVRRELGTYQQEVGPFAAWPELADATKDDRVRQGFTPNDPGLRSGDMRDSVHVKVEGNHASIGSDDPKLLWFEMGTKRGQPPRHVLGGSAFRMKDRIVEAIGSHIVWALRGLGPRND